MTDTAGAFIGHSRKLMTGDYLPRIERCVAAVSDRNIWWRPNAESNSIGNLILHLTGNVEQWIVSGVGGKADTRDRAREFSEQGPLPRSSLLGGLRSAVDDADRVLTQLDAAQLAERRTIQGCDVTVLEAVYHVVEHFSMHTGQIILVTKMWAGDLGFYQVSGGVARPTWNNTSSSRS